MAMPQGPTTLESDPTQETFSLIASDKVESTPVRSRNGDKLGTIKRLMIDKRSGRVAYAMMSFGGFLGLGEDYHAVPWNALHYSEALEAYELDASEEQLKGSPVVSDDANWSDPRWNKDVYGLYGMPGYWI